MEVRSYIQAVVNLHLRKFTTVPFKLKSKRALSQAGWLGKGKGKSKAMLIQAYTGPENSKRARFTDFVTRHINLGKLLALRTPLLPSNFPGTQFLRLGRSQCHSAAGRIMSMKNSNKPATFRSVPQSLHCPTQNCTQQFLAVGHVAAVHCTGLLQTAGQYIKQQFCTVIVLPDDGTVMAETCNS